MMALPDARPEEADTRPDSGLIPFPSLPRPPARRVVCVGGVPTDFFLGRYSYTSRRRSMGQSSVRRARLTTRSLAYDLSPLGRVHL